LCYDYLVLSLGSEASMDVEVWKDIAIEHDGKVITGSYYVSDRMITVKTKDGRSKSTRMVGNPPELIAKSLLLSASARR